MPKMIVTGHQDDPIRELMEQHNNLVDKFNALLAQLDADAGVSGTNYAATHGVAAADKFTDALTNVEV